MRSVLSLKEHTLTPSVELSAAERDQLRATVPDLRISPSAGSGSRYDLWPTSTIGIVRIGDHTVEIRPRLPLDRVLFLASYAIGNLKWPADAVEIAEAPDVVEAVSRLFVRLVKPCLAQGVLQGYVRLDDRLQTIRGRIRFADQISRWNGQAPPIEVSYDDHTVDILENQLLRAAALRLAAIGGRSSETARDLHRVSLLLSDVSMLAFRGAAVPEVAWTRLNERYRAPVELARLVLQGTGLESAAGRVAAPAFLLNMASVFERFVQRALRESLGLTERTFPENAKSKSLRLDEDGRIVLRPDLSWWERDRCIFVGDCKYKRTDSAIEHADLYQLLAYATATDLPGGLLVYAAGEAKPTEHVVRRAGKTLTVKTLDLAGSPGAIMNQIEGLARLIHDLAASDSSSNEIRGSSLMSGT